LPEEKFHGERWFRLGKQRARDAALVCARISRQWWVRSIRPKVKPRAISHADLSPPPRARLPVDRSQDENSAAKQHSTRDERQHIGIDPPAFALIFVPWRAAKHLGLVFDAGLVEGARDFAIRVRVRVRDESHGPDRALVDDARSGPAMQSRRTTQEIVLSTQPRKVKPSHVSRMELLSFIRHFSSTVM
jgi:hypothetical protein